ncbi:cyclohexanone monooxygenase [Hyaloraphidium curvatum]|nr:cyclohexanone monooxygenase [Hyaloraphidium curvatum]
MAVSSQPETLKLDFDPDALLARYLQERDKRLRSDGQDQYVRIGEGVGAKYAEWFTDIWSEAKPREALNIETTAVILGSGFSGIQMAAQLVARGITDFKIIDRAGDFGGTWYWNRYPGVACDSEAYCYLPLLEETGYMPSHKYAAGYEIRQHCERMAKYYGLYEHSLLNTPADWFRWDDEAALWRGKTKRGDTVTCRFLAVAAGGINHPHIPNVPGIELFKGKEFHTARWDFKYTGGSPDGDYNMTGLNDKTVALIGTGATAIQCVPFLGASAKKLYVIQRTPSAVDVRDNKPTDPNWVKSLPKGWQATRDHNFQVSSMGPLAGDPEELLDDGFTRTTREQWKLVEKMFKGADIRAPDGRPYTRKELLQIGDFMLMERIRKRCEDVVKDKRTADLLKPWYNIWCKRPVYSDTYLPTFNRPNVELVDCSQSKGIERITEKGVVVGGKEYAVDCIIWAAGYHLPAGETFRDFEVYGRGGLKWDEAMTKKGGYASLYGVVTNGFPNYAQTAARQAAVSVNMPSVLNDQAIFAGYLIAEAIKRNLRTFEVTREAEEDWTKQVLAKAGNTAFSNVEGSKLCTPGYYNAEGDLSKLASNLRGAPYGGGPLRYRAFMKRDMDSGKLPGFKVEYADSRPSL